MARRDLETDETVLVADFIVPSKRERYVDFLRSSKARRKFIDALFHFQDFDPAVIVELPARLETREGVLGELRRRGAGRSCYVMSASATLDRSTCDLAVALDRTFASVPGTLICCIPGRLAYYEGEPPNNRFLLHRPP